MDGRNGILLGLGAGAVWAVLLPWGAARFVHLPVFALVPTIMTAFLAPGLVMAAMVAGLALRRLFAAGATGLQLDEPGSGSDIDRRVLVDAAGQIVIALCVWPAAAVILGAAGPGLIMVLGLGLALSLVTYWVGCHTAPPLRAFGFAAGFLPSVLVALWALVMLVLRGF